MVGVNKGIQADELNEEVIVEQAETQIADEMPEAQPPCNTELEKELIAVKEENTQLRDKILRMAAEFENSKKRMERERLTGLKYSGESIFRELLPVVDNLERALTTGIVEGVAAEQNLAALKEGVQLTCKSLIVTLEKFEVKPIDSIGQAFDPTRHEALTMEESDMVPASHVLSEFEKGYYYKDRLLRAAKVIVSSGKKSAE